MGLKITYKNFDTAMNAAKMFNLRNRVTESILTGNFKVAKIAQKEFAKAAVEDFETFKTLPTVKFTNISWGEALVVWFRNLEYKIYRLFSAKSPEEKLLKKQYQAYIKTPDKII